MIKNIMYEQEKKWQMVKDISLWRSLVSQYRASVICLRNRRIYSTCPLLMWIVDTLMKAFSSIKSDATGTYGVSRKFLKLILWVLSTIMCYRLLIPLIACGVTDPEN